MRCRDFEVEKSAGFWLNRQSQFCAPKNAAEKMCVFR